MINLETLEIINRFRPFGIGNPKPLFLIKDATIAEIKYLGNDEKHIAVTLMENRSIRFLYWNVGDKKSLFNIGNIISLVIEIEKNEWNGKVSLQGIIRDIAE